MGPKRRRPAFAEPLESRVLLSSTGLSTTAWTALGPGPIVTGNSSTGPISGRINGIAADPSNANTLYVASAGGGIWKSTDAGSSWTPLTDNQNSLFMGSIAVAASDPSILYGGTGAADMSSVSFYGRGVLKSTDGGATWSLLGNSAFNRHAIDQIVVDPTNSNTVYASVFGAGNNGLGAGEGIWKSTDGGSAWTNTTTAISSILHFTDLQIDPTNPQRLFFAVASGSTNLGGIYESTNGAASWSLLSGLPNGLDLGQIKLAIAPSNPQVLYASIADPNTQALTGTWTSSDGGTTWAQLAGVPNYLGNQAWFDSTLIVDPHNSDIVYAGGQSSIIQSMDGGQHWTDITAGANGTETGDDHHAIAFDANGRLLDGTGAGIWRLDNATPASTSWSDLNGNLQITQLFSAALSPSDPNSVMGGTLGNGSVQYSGSTAWAQRLTGDQGMVQFDPQNPATIYQQTPNSPTFFSRSDDGGSTWTTKTSGINPADPQYYPAPFVVDPNNGNHLLYATDHIYESFNGGDSWTAISAPNTNGWTVTGTVSNLVMSPTDSNTIYATASGVILSTHNHGATWEQSVGINGNYSKLLADPANPQVAYVTRWSFGGQHVARTDDGGLNWQDLSGNLPNLPVYSLAINPAVAGEMFAGTDGGVYFTTNDGASWSPFASGLPDVQVRDLEFNSSQNILAAATFGRGVWEISTAATAPLVVNTLADETNPNDGLLSLREAVAVAQTSGQTITFDPSLAGGTLALIAANGPLDMTGSITIDGSAAAPPVISGAAGAPVEIAGGSTVRIAHVTLAGSATSLQVDAGGQVLLQDVNVTAPVVDNGSLLALQFADGTWPGAITGSGALTKSGPADLSLTGSNAYTGGTSVRSGTLTGNTSAIQGNVSVATGTILALDQSTLSGADGLFFGSISGGGMLHIVGPSSVVRLGTNSSQVASSLTNSGTTTIDAGADLIATGAGQFSANSDYIVNGSLDLGGFNQAVATLAGAATGTVYNLTSQSSPLATLTLQGSHTATYSGILENVPVGSSNPGVFALDKSGGGYQYLVRTADAANTYTGGTTLTGGPLIGNTQSIQGAITNNGALTIDQLPGGINDGVLNAVITGGNGITVASGIVRLAPGASINTQGFENIAGTLVAGASNDLGRAAAYTITGTLDLAGFDQTVNALFGPGTVYNSAPDLATLTLGGNVGEDQFAGILEDHISGTSGGTLALVKNGVGPVDLAGPNTYSGGTTVTQGTLVIGPSPGDPLGSGPLNLAGGTVQFSGQSTAPVQETVPTTGYNQDVVVEASSADPLASTTTPFDGYDVGGNNVLYEQGFDGSASAGTGLPTNGLIASQFNPGVTFQLQPYNANNVAFLSGAGSSVTLQLVHPSAFTSINILWAGANGGGAQNISLHFSDGTVVGALSSSGGEDWFGAYQNTAYIVGGRVLRSPNAPPSVLSTVPRLFETDIPIDPADQSKILTSVTFSEPSGNQIGIFALSGTALTLLPTQSYPNSVNVTGNSTIDVETAPVTLSSVSINGAGVSFTSASGQRANVGSVAIASGGISVTGNPGTIVQISQITMGSGVQFTADTGDTLFLGNLNGGTNRFGVGGGGGAVALTGTDSFNYVSVFGNLLVENAAAIPFMSGMGIYNGHVQLVPSPTPYTVTVDYLDFSGTLDIGNNAFKVNSASSGYDATPTIRAAIIAGTLYSSLADANHVLGYADGSDGIISGMGTDQTLVKLTVPGDANLDGKVDLADLLILVRNFGLAGANWDLGDFNYDGTVNLADFLILSRHLGQSYPTPPISQPATPTAAPSDDQATLRPARRRLVPATSTRPASP